MNLAFSEVFNRCSDNERQTTSQSALNDDLDLEELLNQPFENQSTLGVKSDILSNVEIGSKPLRKERIRQRIAEQYNNKHQKKRFRSRDVKPAKREDIKAKKRILQIRKPGLSQKMNKNKYIDKHKVSIMRVSTMQKCVLPYTKKKYTIIIHYVLKSDIQKGVKPKIRKKTINFGNVNQKEYFQTGDDEERLRLMTRIKNYDSPFKSNYWRVNLLNNKRSLKESWTEVMELLGIMCDFH